MKKQKRGFTLIELLVVVLIIGILAAVALPQYQVAVDKTRFNTMRFAVHALHNAQQEYKLANGYYATSFDDLSVGMPSQCQPTSENILDCGAFNINIRIQDGKATYVFAMLNTPRVSYVIHSDGISCYAYRDGGERALRVCRSQGGVQVTAENAGCGGSCTIFKLN